MSCHRTLTAGLVLLALVVSLPGWLCAGCEACTSKPAPAASGHPETCCHGSHCAPAAIEARADCCGHGESATPPAVPQASAAPVQSVAPASVPALPVRPAALRIAAFHTPEEPPPLHEGLSLYTLHAAFLI